MGWDGMLHAELQEQPCIDGLREKTIQAILRHANVSTANTYDIKSAADDTRATMAKLERLLIGDSEGAASLSGN